MRCASEPHIDCLPGPHPALHSPSRSTLHSPPGRRPRETVQATCRCGKSRHLLRDGTAGRCYLSGLELVWLGSQSGRVLAPPSASTDLHGKPCILFQPVGTVARCTCCELPVVPSVSSSHDNGGSWNQQA